MTSILYRYNIRRAHLIRFIIAEFLIMAVAVVMIYNISWDHITERRLDTCSEIIGTTSSTFGEYASYSATTVSEQVKEEVSETVWITKDGVNYRTGPNITYSLAGTLDEYDSLYRTGVTYNEWSLVEIDDEEYYIKSSNLTTEAPFNLASGAKGEYQRYALSLMSEYGWADEEIIPLINLWNRESGWNPRAHNKSSGAHGIPQALPAKKMAAFGSDYYTNGNTQIRWGLNYIKNRYGSPSAAWGHFCSKGWY